MKSKQIKKIEELIKERNITNFSFESCLVGIDSVSINEKAENISEMIDNLSLMVKSGIVNGEFLIKIPKQQNMYQNKKHYLYDIDFEILPKIKCELHIYGGQDDFYLKFIGNDIQLSSSEKKKIFQHIEKYIDIEENNHIYWKDSLFEKVQNENEQTNNE